VRSGKESLAFLGKKSLAVLLAIGLSIPNCFSANDGWSLMRWMLI
jgi:hypothetical protein